LFEVLEQPKAIPKKTQGVLVGWSFGEAQFRNPNQVSFAPGWNFGEAQLEGAIASLELRGFSQGQATSGEPIGGHFDQLVFAGFGRSQELCASKCIAEKSAFRFRSHEVRCLAETMTESVCDIANGKLLQTRDIQSLGR
jgi:hypothetical protein